MFSFLRFLLEALRSRETVTVMICSARQSRATLPLKVWQLRMIAGLLLFFGIGAPLFVANSVSQYVKRQGMQENLIALRSELFAYQVRYDEVYEEVYFPEDQSQQNGLQTSLSEKPSTSDPAELDSQKLKEVILERSSRPDSLFPDSAIPISLTRHSDQNKHDRLPIRVILEPIFEDLSEKQSFRLQVENLAFPQKLEFQIGVVAHAKADDGGAMKLSLLSGQLIDVEEMTPDVTEAIHATISEQIWTYEFSVPKNSGKHEPQWQSIQLHLADLEGDRVGEYDYQLGQLSKVLSSSQITF